MILIRTYDSVHCQFIVKSFIIVSLTLFSYLVLRIHLINKQRTPKTNESDIKIHSITHEKENVNVIKKITTNIVIHVMSRKTLHLLLQYTVGEARYIFISISRQLDNHHGELWVYDTVRQWYYTFPLITKNNTSQSNLNYEQMSSCLVQTSCTAFTCTLQYLAIYVYKSI